MQNKLFFKLTTSPIFLVFLLLPFSVFSTFTISNNCPFTIWPGTLSGSGTPPLSTTGFQLESGKTVRLDAIPGWSGRIWARTGCRFDATGAGMCLTGDCGGRLECDGSGATPPASLFEITLGQGNDKDFYDVSIVDGYNLPIVAWPTGPNGAACNATGCISDINTGCPKELQVVGGDEKEGVIACKSACEAFGQDQYCCSGQFANPTTCKPTYYSTVFKRACPRAYSYAYDDGTSTFTCKAYNYDIVFCPSTAAMKKKPFGSTAMSPPHVPYDSPSISYGTPPSNTYSSPPIGYGTPTSNTYSSPPVGYGTSPSTTYNSPPTGYETPPSFIYDSPPTIRKHSYGASEGEVSSAYAIPAYHVHILIPFSMLLWL
ncbi:pathogenesis-related thaumatin-like protein 3.5 [Amaranthus tricolor]|uniref:pathogenesis-related thaumatin-like protein 3.5 n=1 Tax=Amaranthus tricolor TaxID=29722 RepID=UPI002583ED17|nr:pathogenesis-related thaumatin-like protein 3.5 [Amaranthus tricolor]